MKFLDYPVSNKFRSKTPAGFYDPIKHHTGVDYVCPEGTDIVLPFPTTYHSFLTQKEMGNTLYLKDYYGNILVFAHLSKTLVPDSGKIGKNQVFAKSGNTGSATTNPHVHFEVITKTPKKGLEFMTRKLGYVDGYNIDPVKYLKSMEVKQRKVNSWLALPTLKRVMLASVTRLRNLFKK